MHARPNGTVPSQLRARGRARAGPRPPAACMHVQEGRRHLSPRTPTHLLLARGRESEITRRPKQKSTRAAVVCGDMSDRTRSSPIIPAIGSQSPDDVAMRRQGSHFRFYCSEFRFFDQSLTFILFNLKPKSQTFRTEIRISVFTENKKKSPKFRSFRPKR